jgi:hypothetical protein
MPTTVTITNLTGSSPYDVWVCDTSLSTCIYVNTFTSIPYTFEVPYVYSSFTEFVVKIVDNNDCIKTNTITL